MLLDPFPIVGPDYSVAVTLEVFKDGAASVCGIYLVEGTINLRPKAWLVFARDVLARLEQQAAEAGCSEIRMCGRDWSLVAKGRGYEPIALPGGPNGLRKFLQVSGAPDGCVH